jgi:hypothetical protein
MLRTHLSAFSFSRFRELCDHATLPLDSRNPETRSAEIPKFHTKVLSRFATSGFSLHCVPAPCRQDSRYAEPRNTEMSMFHTKGTSRFATSGFSMLRSRFLVIRIPGMPNPEIPKCRCFTSKGINGCEPPLIQRLARFRVPGVCDAVTPKSLATPNSETRNIRFRAQDQRLLTLLIQRSLLLLRFLNVERHSALTFSQICGIQRST